MISLIYILIPILVVDLASSVPKKLYECANPNNKLGVCISLYDCPTVLKLFLNAPGSPEGETFLQESYCENGFGTSPFVCCTNQNLFLRGDTRIMKPQSTQEECTRDSYLSIAVWPVSKRNCIGSILNDRYILSSAWCVKNSPSHVTYLGTSQSSNLAIEKKLPHENYTVTDDNLWDHDIGMLRLSTSIQFNTEIAPICLPSGISGFNNYQIEDVILFPVRDEDDVNLIRLGTLGEKCEENNREPYPNQFVRNDKRSRHYNSMEYGAPLVAKYNGAWVIYAVYGFHAHSRSCPIFTRVSSYENWILNNMEE